MKHAPFIVCDFKIKKVDESSDPDNFIIEGLASPYGNIDSYRDIVMPGSFTTSLIKKGTSRSILWQHRSDEPVGVGEMSDSIAGLETTIKLPKSDTFVVGRVMPQVKIGAVKGLSIGYRTIKEEWDTVARVNRLLEIELREVSICTFPANELAQITAAKQFLGIDIEQEKIESHPFMDEKTEWNPEDAITQLGDSKDGYLFHGEDGNNSLPYCYKSEDGIRIVPNAIFELTGSIDKKNIPGYEKDNIKSFINSVYKKLGKEEPFKHDKLFIDTATLKHMKKEDLDIIFDNDNIILSTNAKKLIISSLRSPDIEGSVSDDDSFLTELKDLNEEIKSI